MTLRALYTHDLYDKTLLRHLLSKNYWYWNETYRENDITFVLCLKPETLLAIYFCRSCITPLQLQLPRLSFTGIFKLHFVPPTIFNPFCLSFVSLLSLSLSLSTSSFFRFRIKGVEFSKLGSKYRVTTRPFRQHCTLIVNENSWQYLDLLIKQLFKLFKRA